MRDLKRWGFTLGLAAIAVLDVLIFKGSDAYNRSLRMEDPQKKIELLESANSIYPFNDLVYYELGKAWLDQGVASLSDRPLSQASFEKSIRSFRRSLDLNPASYFGHFQLARALDNLSLFDAQRGRGAFEEYRKAVLLAGQNGEIYYEVGRTLFSSWPQLSGDDREFTIALLKRVCAQGNLDRIRDLLETWEMNVRDYPVIDRILPDDAQALRLCARFYGERSLSLAERQKYLARAESLEFQRAKSEFGSGDASFLYSRIDEAESRFASSLNLLSRIKFYQSLAHSRLIDPGEYRRVLKMTHLNLAKCQVEGGKSLSAAETHLRKYLDLENDLSAVTELETYLKERNLVSTGPGPGETDLGKLSFELDLQFRLNRYGDIIKVGSSLEQSYVVVPRAKLADFVRILQTVGDAYQKAGYLYEAERLYQKALGIDPQNLGTMARIRSNCERLGKHEELLKVEKAMELVLSSREMLSSPRLLPKEEPLTSGLTLDGRKIELEWAIQEEDTEERPLITVFFNDQVVFESYLESSVASLVLDSNLGENPLQMVAVNRPVTLLRLGYVGLE